MTDKNKDKRGIRGGTPTMRQRRRRQVAKYYPHAIEELLNFATSIKWSNRGWRGGRGGGGVVREGQHGPNRKHVLFSAAGSSENASDLHSHTFRIISLVLRGQKHYWKNTNSLSS